MVGTERPGWLCGFRCCFLVWLGLVRALTYRLPGGAGGAGVASIRCRVVREHRLRGGVLGV